MSDLPKAGVQLVAEGSDTFFQQLGQGESDMAAFGRAAQTTAGGINTFGSAQDSAANKIASLSQKIDLQQRQLGILQQELAQTNAKYGEGSIQAQKKQLAIDKLSASIATNEQQLRGEVAALSAEGQAAENAAQKTNAFGEIMTGALRAVGEFAVQALLQAGRAVVSWVQQSTEAAREYQRVMSDIVGLTGTSAESVQTLSQEVLSLSGEVAQAPQDLAKGLYFVASSGFQGADAMTVLNASAHAAAAGLGETQTIADLVTSTLNAYQMGAGQAAHVTDILTQAVKDGKAEPDQLAGAMGRVLAVAAAAGISFEQVAASIASMTRVGLDANESVTALRGIISALEKPSAQARDALQGIGLSADQVRASIRDKGLLATLQDLYTRTNGNLDVLGKLIPNVRALTGVLSTTASQGDAYAETLAHMESAAGATDKAFKQATTTLDFQEKALVASTKALQIEIGQALIPLLTSGTHALLEMAQGMQGHVGPAITAIGQALQTYGIPALEGLSAALLAYAVTSIPTAITATTAFVASLAPLALAAAPFVAIAAAVGAMAYAINDFNSKVQASAQGVLESRDWWNASTQAIADYGNASDGTKQQLSGLADAVQTQRQLIQGEIDALGRRMAMGQESDAQYAADMEVINQHRVALTASTAALKEQMDLAAQRDAYDAHEEALHAMVTAQGGFAQAVHATDDELKEAQKTLDKVAKDGPKALQDVTSTYNDFLAKQADAQAAHEQKLADLQAKFADAKTAKARDAVQQQIDAENKGYQESQVNAALAYGKEEAAQRAHLGQMLIDYIKAEEVKNAEFRTRGDALIAEISRQYGITENLAANSFGKQLNIVDQYEQGVGGDARQVAQHLSDVTDAAANTQRTMNSLARNYTIGVVEDFNKHKLNAEGLANAAREIPARVSTEVLSSAPSARDEVEDYKHSLASIPKRVNTEVHTSYTHSGTNDSGTSTTGSAYSGHASGGDFSGKEPFWVGEEGKELIFPGFSGTVVSNDQIRGAIAGFGASSAKSRGDAGAVPGVAPDPALLSRMAASLGGAALSGAPSQSALDAAKQLAELTDQIKLVEKQAAAAKVVFGENSAQAEAFQRKLEDLKAQAADTADTALPSLIAQMGDISKIDTSAASESSESSSGAVGRASSETSSGGAAGQASVMQVVAQQVIVQAPPQAIQIAGAISSQTTYAPQFNLGVQTNNSPAAVQQSYAIVQALYGRS